MVQRCISATGLLFDEGVEIALTQGDDGRIASVMMLACQEDVPLWNCLCVRSNIGISLINYLSIGQYYFSRASASKTASAETHPYSSTDKPIFAS